MKSMGEHRLWHRLWHEIIDFTMLQQKTKKCVYVHIYTYIIIIIIM